ncbi:MAG: permease-like cell division protein FtsX [Firmicutes bacterium]|nr:permease-like cell division protein FtsX [Bacillota bacterium]
MSLFYTLKQAFIQFFRNLNTGIVSIFAITAMLLILSIFFIATININMAAETIKGDYDSIQVYLTDETTADDAQMMVADIKTVKGVEDARYQTKEEAMAEFKTRWGDNSYLLENLQENPLPNSVIIQIGDLEQADAIAKKAATYAGVEDIKYYKNTVDKLLKVTRFIQISAVVVMIFLIIISIIVVSNTIKLTVFNRADEISIMKYVGATNWFIRGPFLVEGIIIGLISAGISLAIAAAMYHKIIEVIGDQMMSMLSMRIVPEDFLIYNLTWIFLALGVSIGACGSIISMRKFLNA